MIRSIFLNFSDYAEHDLNCVLRMMCRNIDKLKENLESVRQETMDYGYLIVYIMSLSEISLVGFQQ